MPGTRPAPAPRAPRSPMTRGARALSLIATATAVAIGATGCVAAPSPADGGSDPVLTSLQHYASLDPEGQIVALQADSRDLGVMLIEAAGLPERTGMSAGEIEAALPRPVAPDAASAASAKTAPGPITVRAASLRTAAAGSATPAGAAFDAATLYLRGITNGLATAHSSGSFAAEVTRRSDTWSSSEIVKKGKASNSITATQQATVGGVAMTLEYQVDADLQSCPDQAGLVDGYFTITGGITTAGPGGAPQRTLVTLETHVTASVDDKAWATDAYGEYSAWMESGAPGALQGEVDDSTSLTESTGVLEVAYDFDHGTSKVARARVTDATGDAALGDVAKRVLSKAQQGALAAAEQFWRTGNCVRAEVEAAPDSIGRGDSTEIEVVAAARYGGGAITRATAESTGKNAGTASGKVTPATTQKVPAHFTFTADQKDGVAQPEFTVTSRRGIGFGAADIYVGQTGWVIEGESVGVHHYAVKCDGIPGEWTMKSDGVGFDYHAETAFVIGDDLRGHFTSDVAGGDGTYHDAGEIWFEARPDGYVMHATGDVDPQLPVRPATTECD